jgi:hypothetical protein
MKKKFQGHKTLLVPKSGSEDKKLPAKIPKGLTETTEKLKHYR